MPAMPKIVSRPVAKLLPYARNSRTHSPEQIEQIAASIEEFGFTNPILIDEAGGIIAGHGRALAAQRLRIEKAPCIILAGLSDAQKQAYIIADNKIALNAGWDLDALAAELKELKDMDFNLDLIGFSHGELEDLLAEPMAGDGEAGNATLAERFGVPPFSVLNARGGEWQERKRAWLSKGIKSEEGRNAPAGGSPDLAARQKGESGTSIFDPVLCELAYRWFCPPGGAVLDPFAGGSVRGIVASQLGRDYTGYELRKEQCDANKKQAKEICKAPLPKWVNDDAMNIDKARGAFDFIFTCPPYADLERYSDDPKDLSTMPYDKFRSAYFEIIAKACAKLAQDRFAAIVIGEVRGKKGSYVNFFGDTIAAFIDAGLDYYNEMALITPCGSAAMRAAQSFETSRKLAKTHQNVLIFCKGNPKAAASAIGKTEFGDPNSEDDSDA